MVIDAGHTHTIRYTLDGMRSDDAFSLVLGVVDTDNWTVTRLPKTPSRYVFHGPSSEHGIHQSYQATGHSLIAARLGCARLRLKLCGRSVYKY